MQKAAAGRDITDKGKSGGPVGRCVSRTDLRHPHDEHRSIGELWWLEIRYIVDRDQKARVTVASLASAKIHMMRDMALVGCGRYQS